MRTRSCRLYNRYESGRLPERSRCGKAHSGNWIAFTDSLVKSAPLVFTGIAISVAFSAPLWRCAAGSSAEAKSLALAPARDHRLPLIPKIVNRAVNHDL
jgi:hypothetical protein